MIARRQPIRHVAVLGGGQVALLAACAIKRALPGAAVTVMEMPVASDALADLAHTTSPVLARLHDRIGMDEAGMIARAGAGHRLATCHRSPAGAWWIGEGAADDPASEPGHDRTGVAMSVALAQAERFAEVSDDRASPLSDLDHALRWSPDGHLARLASLARYLGIVRLRASGVVDPAAVNADLVIDAAGPRPRGADWVAWSAELALNRVRTDLLPPSLSLVDTVETISGGVRLTSPGRDATRVVTVCADGDGCAIANGRRGQAWQGHVVAIGDSAAMVPPIGWMNLHLAVIAIELLVELLPGRDVRAVERDEWNRRFALAADAVRDRVAAHLIGHPGEGVRSPALALRIAEFARRARVPAMAEDATSRDWWGQALAGAGIAPGRSARMEAIDPAVRDAARLARRGRIAHGVAMAEPYPEWLARMAGAKR